MGTAAADTPADGLALATAVRSVLARVDAHAARARRHAAGAASDTVRDAARNAAPAGTGPAPATGEDTRTAAGAPAPADARRGRLTPASTSRTCALMWRLMVSAVSENTS
ncbi:hypothetical protein AB0C60_29765, partial [Streptomyces sp. NPDC048845]